MINHEKEIHLNTIHMKQNYVTPETNLFEMRLENSFLASGSVETMNTVAGSWDEDDE